MFFQKKAAVLCALAGLAVSGIALGAHAQEAEDGVGFKRDRNVSVTQRVPSEFRPIGVRAGAFILSPKLLASMESTDNVYYVPSSGKSDVILRVNPSLDLRSGWSRHLLTASLGVGSVKYLAYDSENYETTNFALGGRLDVVGSTNIIAGVTGSSSAEPRSEESSSTSYAELVRYKDNGAYLGATITGNRLRLVVRGDLKDLDYKDVRLVGGGTTNGAANDQDKRDRKETKYLAKAEYAVSPDASVFLSYESNKRDYKTDKSKNSEGTDVSLGANFDLSKLVRGEVQVGSLSQDYKALTGKKVDSTSYKGKLEWFPSELTTVALNASKSVKETPIPTALGYKSDSVKLSVDHELKPNLILSASYDQSENDYIPVASSTYDRNDTRRNASISASLKVSRNAAFEAGYYYSDVNSSGKNKGAEYKNNTIKIGLKIAY